MTYREYVKGGGVFDDVCLPEGAEVRVETRETPVKTLAERYRGLIGIIDDLPADMAENHDHYIHGTPAS